MFKSGLKTQGKFLVKMISILVDEVSDQVAFEKTINKLVDAHNKRGIKAVECKIESFMSVHCMIIFI